MQKFLRCALVMALTLGSASLAAAGDLKLTLGNGRATLVAHEVPLQQILAEWARLGKTTIVNGDKLTGPPVTLELVDRPEREVLEVLLRSASGYIAAQREVTMADASVFDRVMILPTSRGPATVAAVPPPPQFGRPNPIPPPVQMPVVEDDDPVEPGVQTNQPTPNQPMPNPGFPVLPNGMAPQPAAQPPVLTAPRPGMLPAPPAPQPPNPYSTVPQMPQIIRPPGTGPGGPR